jgi:hypothetical protein
VLDEAGRGPLAPAADLGLQVNSGECGDADPPGGPAAGDGL